MTKEDDQLVPILCVLELILQSIVTTLIIKIQFLGFPFFNSGMAYGVDILKDSNR